MQRSDYDDGEKETGVALELIRLKGGKMDSKYGDEPSKTTSKDAGATFRVGARVEALYMGKDKWFKGTVSRANADGTYDVEYDDGDKENRMSSRSLRPLKSAASSFAASQFSAEKPARPSASGGARRRSGNSSD